MSAMHFADFGYFGVLPNREQGAQGLFLFMTIWFGSCRDYFLKDFGPKKDDFATACK